MNSKFILLSKTNKTIEYYTKIFNNFPKKESLLKQCIESDLYELIENLFAYNINDSDRIKTKYLKDFVVKLSMLDFYTKIGYKKKILSKRQFEVICRYIIEARKIAYVLIKGENKVES